MRGTKITKPEVVVVGGFPFIKKDPNDKGVYATMSDGKGGFKLLSA